MPLIDHTIWNSQETQALRNQRVAQHSDAIDRLEAGLLKAWHRRDVNEEAIVREAWERMLFVVAKHAETQTYDYLQDLEQPDVRAQAMHAFGMGVDIVRRHAHHEVIDVARVTTQLVQEFPQSLKPAFALEWAAIGVVVGVGLFDSPHKHFDAYITSLSQELSPQDGADFNMWPLGDVLDAGSYACKQHPQTENIANRFEELKVNAKKELEKHIK